MLKLRCSTMGEQCLEKQFNNPNNFSNTLLSFMMVTLFGGPTFLCKILPVR